MAGVLLLSSFCFAVGLYCLFAQLFHLPTFATTRTAMNLSRSSLSRTKFIETIVLDLSVRVSKLIHLDSLRRQTLERTLSSAKITLTPEIWTARCYVRFFLFMLLVIPTALMFPILVPVIIFLAVSQLFTDLKSAEVAIRKRKGEIETDLPRFASTISQELKNSRNILLILENYQKSARPAFREELEITIGHMKSGNYEIALNRLEARVGSHMLSQVTLGLQAVLRGDNGTNYFELLAFEFDQTEYKDLKKEVEKTAPKVNMCTVIVFIAFILVIFYVLGMQIYQSYSSFGL